MSSRDLADFFGTNHHYAQLTDPEHKDRVSRVDTEKVVLWMSGV